MKKRLWFFIGLATNLVVSSSIIVSCGHNEQKPIDDPLNYDQKFGFNDATYTKLEDDLRKELDLKIKYVEKYRKQGENQEQWDEKIAELGGNKKIINQLNNELLSFRSDFFESGGSLVSSSFNIKTESLINFAKKKYDINLSREINLKDMQNECNEIKTSYLDYLQNSYTLMYKDDPDKTKKIQDKIDDFETKFNNYYEEIKHDGNDKAVILNKLRVNLINYMKDVDDELTLLAANNQLKDFLSTYKFEANKEKVSKNSLYWNELNDPNNEFNPSSKPKDISKIIDSAFNILNTNNINVFSTAIDNNEYSYTNTIKVADYKLTPYLVGLKEDAVKNAYYINVDWQLVNQDVYEEKLQKYIDYEKYEDDEEAIKVAEKDENFLKEIDSITAHSYNYDNSSDYDWFEGDEEAIKQQKDVDNNFNNICSYLWPVTNQYAKENLYKTFIWNSDEEKKKINFSWLNDEDATNGYDTFLANYNDKNVANVNLKTLSQCGLMINNQPISKIIEEMETNSDEEIENDPAKLCLKYCDLSGEYHFKNPEVQKKCEINVDLVLSYKFNNDEQEITCNPHAENFTQSQSKNPLQVPKQILMRFSRISYEIFCQNYKSAKDKQDIDKIDSNLKQTVEIFLKLAGWVAILTAIIVLLVIIQSMRWKKWKDDFVAANQVRQYVTDSIARVQKQMNYLIVVFACLTALLGVFLAVYIVPITNYRTKLERFKDIDPNREDGLKFVQKIGEYGDYYSDRKKYDDLAKEESGNKKWLEITKYVNNVEQNGDYQDYLTKRKEEGVLDPWSTTGLQKTSIVFLFVIFIVALLLTLLLLALVSFGKNRISEMGDQHFAGHNFNDIFIKNSVSRQFLWAATKETFFCGNLDFDAFHDSWMRIDRDPAHAGSIALVWKEN